MEKPGAFFLLQGEGWQGWLGPGHREVGTVWYKPSQGDPRLISCSFAHHCLILVMDRKDLKLSFLKNLIFFYFSPSLAKNRGVICKKDAGFRIHTFLGEEVLKSEERLKEK